MNKQNRQEEALRATKVLMEHCISIQNLHISPPKPFTDLQVARFNVVYRETKGEAL